MRKFVVHRLLYDFEKEERWLNQMAAKGMNFIDFTFGRYLFEQGTPGEYIYRIELLPHLASHPESKAYIEFMESLNVEYMGNWTAWVYFRKKASDGPFELFSDFDSKIKHYRRISLLFGIVSALNLFACLNNFRNIPIAIASNHESYIYSVLLFNGIAAIGLSWLVFGYIRKILQLRKEKQLYA